MEEMLITVPPCERIVDNDDDDADSWRSGRQACVVSMGAVRFVWMLLFHSSRVRSEMLEPPTPPV